MVLLVFGQYGGRWAWFRIRVRSRSSRRRVPVRRSQMAFIRGACTAVRTMMVPVAWKWASNDAAEFDPSPTVIAELQTFLVAEGSAPPPR